ncbi:tetratricopeptide repeat protein [uncultured Roseobacter sp.]|uniref:tetratricopeptide repeat protein n=1 Tax=uncultured Roseobacter sp. TaxID=114847 RepID=UPI00262C5D0F|nr:tetratricopeptide repeat protein [uncultured Roseobacter sp.]
MHQLTPIRTYSAILTAFFVGLGAYASANNQDGLARSVIQVDLKSLKKGAWDKLYGGEWSQAIDDFTEAIRYDPDDWGSYRGRYTTYGIVGEWEKALHDANKAIELNPDHMNSFTERAHILQKLGEFDRALSDLNEAVSRFPEWSDVYSQRARVLIELEKCTLALENAKEASRLDPRDDHSNRLVAELVAAGPKCGALAEGEGTARNKNDFKP